MDPKPLLQRLGLSEHESRLYVGLIESGPSTIAAIAKKTGLHRPTVYSVVDDLIERGLVTPGQRGARTFFTAEPPEKLQYLLEDAQRDLYQLIPELKALVETKNKRPVSKLLEGKQGIAFVFDDLVKTLKHGDVFYRYSSARQSRDAYLPKNYREIRDQKKLERFVITNPTQAAGKGPRMERAVKVVPEKYGLFDQDVTQVIYGNKVAFIDYNSETALLVENPALAAFQKNLFKMLYDKL